MKNRPKQRNDFITQWPNSLYCLSLIGCCDKALDLSISVHAYVPLSVGYGKLRLSVVITFLHWKAFCSDDAGNHTVEFKSLIRFLSVSLQAVPMDESDR